MLGDLVRYTLGGMGVLLAVSCGGGLVYAQGWDQRSRFATLLGYGAIIIGGQLDGLGHAPTWRTFALLPVTVLAVISTGAFLIRHVRATRGGPGVGRSRSDQRGVFRPRAVARRVRRAGDGAQPPSGDPAA